MFGIDEIYQLILLFSLFLLLLMGFTALFSTIHRSHYTISANFYLYLQYFQQKIFNFSKISGSQTDPKWCRFYQISQFSFKQIYFKLCSNSWSVIIWFNLGLTQHILEPKATIFSGVFSYFLILIK